MPDYDQIAYEAWATHQGWQDGDFHDLDPWETVHEDIKEAWQAAIVAVIEAYEGRAPR